MGNNRRDFILKSCVGLVGLSIAPILLESNKQPLFEVKGVRMNDLFKLGYNVVDFDISFQYHGKQQVYIDDIITYKDRKFPRNSFIFKVVEHKQIGFYNDSNI